MPDDSKKYNEDQNNANNQQVPGMQPSETSLNSSKPSYQRVQDSALTDIVPNESLDKNRKK